MSEMHVDVWAIGSRVRIVVPDSAPVRLLDLIRTAWSEALAADEDIAPDIEISVPHGVPEDELMEWLTSGVTLAALRERAGSMLLLHAAGIDVGGGQVIAFVGAPGAGKTTLSRALAKDFGYVSDEAVAVGSNGQVLPYRKPFSVRKSEDINQPKHQVSPSTVGRRSPPGRHLRIKRVVLLDRVKGDEGPSVDWHAPEIHPVPLLEAIGGLLPQTSYVTSMNRPMLRYSQLCDMTGGFLRLRYREATDIRQILPELIKESVSDSWTDIGDEGFDAVETIDGTVGVLVGRHLHALGGIAPKVMVGLRAGDSFAQIEKTILSQFGEPPSDAKMSVGEIIASISAQLRAAGIVDTNTVKRQ